MRNASNNPSLEWMIDALGVARTFELCVGFGCTRVYVPRTGANEGLFSNALTKRELALFSERWPSETIKLPLARTFCCQYLAEVEGRGTADIARRLHMKEENVRRALRGTDASLFERAKAEFAKKRNTTSC